MLSFEDFKTSLTQVHSGGVLSFAGMSEPFANPDCAKMLRYAFEQGYELLLFSTFELMTDKDWDLIKDIDFKSVIIHVADAENNTKFILAEDYPKKIEKVLARFPDAGISCHGSYHPVIKSLLSDRCNLSNLMSDRAGNLDLKDKKIDNIDITFLASYNHKGKISCAYKRVDGGINIPLHTMLPDGTVVACCNDYRMTHTFGNLLTQTWGEIAEGAEYNRIKNGMEDESVDNILCRTCYQATGKRKSGSDWMYFPSLYQTVNYKYVAPYLTTGTELELNTLPPGIRELVERLRNAKNICVFGMGNLFKSHYYQSSWNRLINANIFSDNSLDGNTEYNGVSCVPPERLAELDGLLVISFISGYHGAHKQLEELGIHNVVNILEIVNILNDTE